MDNNESKNKITIHINLSITIIITPYDVVYTKERESIEQKVEQQETEVQLKRSARHESRLLIDKYNIDEYGKNMIIHFARREPKIFNNREAIEHWVMIQFTVEGSHVEELDDKFKNVLSVVDPMVELYDF